MTESKVSGLEFKLNNGEIVNLSLSFSRLNVLRKLNSNLYERFNRVFLGKSDDILDLVTVVYVGYWCANYSITGTLYTEEDFIELVPFDSNELTRVFGELTQPKKK